MLTNARPPYLIADFALFSRRLWEREKFSEILRNFGVHINVPINLIA